MLSLPMHHMPVSCLGWSTLISTKRTILLWEAFSNAIVSGPATIAQTSHADDLWLSMYEGKDFPMFSKVSCWDKSLFWRYLQHSSYFFSFVHGRMCLNIVLKELSKPFLQSSILTWNWNQDTMKSSGIYWLGLLYCPFNPYSVAYLCQVTQEIDWHCVSMA